MPCLEISMPRADRKKKELLSAQLTEAFASATGFDAGIFGIRYLEYKEGEVASGGTIWDGQAGRPYLHMLLHCPRLTRTVKQKVVDTFSAVFTKCLSEPDWKPVIHICEHPYDNVGVEGKLLSDSYEACANSKYYYDLPRD